MQCNLVFFNFFIFIFKVKFISKLLRSCLIQSNQTVTFILFTLKLNNMMNIQTISEKILHNMSQDFQFDPASKLLELAILFTKNTGSQKSQLCQCNLVLCCWGHICFFCRCEHVVMLMHHLLISDSSRYVEFFWFGSSTDTTSVFWVVVLVVKSGFVRSDCLLGQKLLLICSGLLQ